MRPGPEEGWWGDGAVPAPGSQLLRREQHVDSSGRQAELFSEVGSGRDLCLCSAELQSEALGGRGGAAAAGLSGEAGSFLG